jgi:hypothetical protein
MTDRGYGTLAARSVDTMRNAMFVVTLCLLPALALAGGDAPPKAKQAVSDETLKHAMQDILRHYYSVKVTVQYCASRFDDMKPDLKASHSAWVKRNSEIVSAARRVILKNKFSRDRHALDEYLMAQVQPRLKAITRSDSADQKLICFDTMVGIDDGEIDIPNIYKDEYKLLSRL